MVLLGRIELDFHPSNHLKNNGYFLASVPVVIAGCNRFGKARPQQQVVRLKLLAERVGHVTKPFVVKADLEGDEAVSAQGDLC